MSQLLPADCLNEIFEYFENDKVTLHSCLLVNQLWCEISVRILWTSVWNYNTLIACLPNESKEILFTNGIITSTPTSKPPLFDYVAFIKNLEIDKIIENILENYQSTIQPDLNYKKYVVAQEIYKLLMNKIPSLKNLHFYSSTITCIPNTTFTLYPGARDCLANLSKLSCSSDIYPEFFYQLSQICHNIHSLKIKFTRVISNGLTDLIFAQKNLKCLDITQLSEENYLTQIIHSLTKHSNTIIKLRLYDFVESLSFITKFVNLQELILSFGCKIIFKELEYVTFPQLQVLNFTYYGYLKWESLQKFLENNGKNLKELYMEKSDNSMTFAI